MIPTSGARGDASLWTRCSPSAAATRALVGRCIALPSGPNGPGGSSRTGGCERSRCAPSRGRPPLTAGDPPPHTPPPYSSAHTWWQPASWRCCGRAPTPPPKTTPTSRRRTCPASSDASFAPSTTSSKRTRTSWSRYGHPTGNPRAHTAETTPPHRQNAPTPAPAHTGHQGKRAHTPGARTRTLVLTTRRTQQPTPAPQLRALRGPPRPSPPPPTPQPPPPHPPHPAPPPRPHPALHPPNRGGNFKNRPPNPSPRRETPPPPRPTPRRGPRPQPGRNPRPPPSSRPNLSARRGHNPQPNPSQSPSLAPRWQRKPVPPRTSSMTSSPSHPRPEGSRAQHGAPPPSPTPPRPPSWRSAPRPKRGAPRPATSQSPHPRPTDRPRPRQNDARVRQQGPRPPTNPRCQPTCSTCPTTAAAVSPKPSRPRGGDRAHTPTSPHPLAPPLPAHLRRTELRGIPRARHRHQSSQPHTHPRPLLRPGPRPRPGTMVAALDPHAALGPAKVGPGRALPRGPGPPAPQGVGGELLPPAGGWVDAAGCMGSHAGRCAPPPGSSPPQPPRAPGPPVCPQAPAGDPPEDRARRHQPVGHHSKPYPAHTHPLTTPQVSLHRHQRHPQHPRGPAHDTP